MDNNDPITAKKFFKGAASPKTGLKAIAFLGWLLIFGFLGFTFWKAYLKKPEPAQQVIAKKGSTVKVIQNNERKKTLIPFVEGFVGQSNNERMNTGIRAGVRFEW